MSRYLSRQLQEFISQGQDLEKFGPSFDHPSVLAWRNGVISTLRPLGGFRRQEYETITKCNSLETLILSLKSWAIKEATGLDTFENGNELMGLLKQKQSEIVLQFLLDLQYANLDTETREGVKELFLEILTELQQPDGDWRKAIEMAKKSLDYEFKIGMDILRLVETYYCTNLEKQ